MNEFQPVCKVDELVSDAGVAALMKDTQIALFYVGGEVFAMDNFDPVGRANVMSRGMTGDLNGELMVASPLQKQHYSLRSGECLDNPEIVIPVYEACIDGDWVKVRVP